MLKQRVIDIVSAIALLLAVIGARGIAAGSLGQTMTPQAFACEGSGSSGGC